MKIGMIDCDNKNNKNPFPNLCLMKLSAWHKRNGDTVEWYEQHPFEHFDKVYVSKVFSFSPDYEYFINADEIIKGGSGYAISMVDGHEVYDKGKDQPLPYEIEHIYPDYSLYNITDTAYGFLSRGCPRGCDFCHVAAKEGKCSVKVANLSEFWNGQKYIKLLDPNLLACKDRKDLLQQLVDSNAKVDFTQGVDIRLMTEEYADYFTRIKIDQIHFAWDRYEDKDLIVPKLKKFAEITKLGHRKIIAYCLVGDRERRILPTDMERIYTMREIGVNPYVMIYDKESLPKGHELKKLQRWVNNRFLWESCKTFEDFINGKDSMKKE